MSEPARGASCLYEGAVRHRRHDAVAHELRHRVLMAYLDLDELPACLDASLLWSARRPAPAWFRRADHLGDPREPLAGAVRELVRERAGVDATGPVRLLTNLRYFGYCFNPVSFYYCFDQPGRRVVAAVAHVTNTPWRESHSYVLPVACESDHGTAALVRGSVDKRLHVSPLMGMDQAYDWRLTVPARRLSVHIESRASGGEPVFDATLSLRRRELTAAEMRRALARYPLHTLAIVARIYGHALALRARGAPWFSHPRQGAAAA